MNQTKIILWRSPRRKRYITSSTAWVTKGFDFQWGTMLESKNQKKIYGIGIPLKKTTAPMKEMSKLLVEERQKHITLKTMAEKSKKFIPVESISMHLQISQIFYVIYKNEESEDKALRKLINEE